MTVVVEKLAQSFSKAICKTIQGRHFRTQPIVVRLDAELMVYRRSRRRNEAPPDENFTAAELDVDPHWGEITNLAGMFRIGIESMPEVKAATVSSEMTRPLNTLMACRVARRLLVQMGVDAPCFSDDVDEAGPVWQPGDDLLEASRCLPALIADDLVEQLRQRIPPQAAMLCLEVKRDMEFAAWRGWDGKMIRAERISRLMQSIMTPVAKTVAGRIKDISVTRKQRTKTAFQMLGRMSPAVLDALELACDRKKTVLMRLCAGHIRGGRIPMDVWLVIGGGWRNESGSSVTLEARRAHHEFVLQACNGDRFYFPPIQLIARLEMTSQGVRVCSPRVRQPAGGFAWIHPYSGMLERDPYEGAVYYADDDDPAMHQPSQEAVAVLPRLANRTDVAMENTLCLANQTRDIRRQQHNLHGPLAAGNEADVLGAITALHDIVRHGLTRGHQRDQSAPRAEMATEVMFYPLRRKALPEPLARRQYKYHEGDLPRAARDRAADLLNAIGRGELPF